MSCENVRLNLKNSFECFKHYVYHFTLPRGWKVQGCVSNIHFKLQNQYMERHHLKTNKIKQKKDLDYTVLLWKTYEMWEVENSKLAIEWTTFNYLNPKFKYPFFSLIFQVVLLVLLFFLTEQTDFVTLLAPFELETNAKSIHVKYQWELFQLEIVWNEVFSHLNKSSTCGVFFF